ncbi:MAG: holo-ACP synthase [Clostridia bacterium]|nr:holo-ACP synthase [Clostridia bacterium]
MIGIGIDIVEINRIEKAQEKNPRFLTKIFTEKEIAYMMTKNKSETIAGMFAAKEAVSKVLGTGISGFKWQHIEIDHTNMGQPIVNCYEGAKTRMEDLGIEKILISISHSKAYAVANAVGV